VNIGLLHPPLAVTLSVVQVKLNQAQSVISSTAQEFVVFLHNNLPVFCVSQEVVILHLSALSNKLSSV
jgi:hypothetical protein